MQSQEHCETTNRPKARAILVCPQCRSNRAEIVNSSPLRAQCFDCDTTYPIDAIARMDVAGQKITPRNRKTKADYRAEITPAPTPARQFLESAVNEALARGPCGVREQQRIAINAAKRYMEHLEDEWRKETPYLKDLDCNDNPKARAGARYARRWRPRFLAAYSISASFTVAARYARIDRHIAYVHRQKDQEFAAQVADAYNQAIDLLEARAFQRALEGDLEPVYYMGFVVDYVRKFDSKLQIELLRAKRPETFKTPGVNVNVGTKGDIFVLTEEQRHILMDVNRQWILDHPPPAEEPPRELGDTAVSQICETQREGLTTQNTTKAPPQ